MTDEEWAYVTKLRRRVRRSRKAFIRRWLQRVAREKPELFTITKRVVYAEIHE